MVCRQPSEIGKTHPPCLRAGNANSMAQRLQKTNRQKTLSMAGNNQGHRDITPDMGWLDAKASALFQASQNAPALETNQTHRLPQQASPHLFTLKELIVHGTF